jgi:hypothetical protein
MDEQVGDGQLDMKNKFMENKYIKKQGNRRRANHRIAPDWQPQKHGDILQDNHHLPTK